MSKKIIFMGTPEFSVQTLEVLAKSTYQIECVYTQSAKKSARGQKIKKSPIQVTSERLGLNVRCPINFNDKEYEYLKSIKPYIVVVVAYGKIIPKKFLELSKKGFLNIHASLLPRWRGAAPIQRAIMNQDNTTGISFMKIEEGLDEGPYLKQIKTPIDQQTTSEQLSKKLSELGAENILECIKVIEKGDIKFQKQDSTKATYAKKISKKETKINWQESARNILSKINSFNPSPVAWFNYNGLRHKVWKAKISELKGNAGEVIDENLTIACGEKSLRITEIQKEGKNRMLAKDFILGDKIKKGDRAE